MKKIVNKKSILIWTITAFVYSMLSIIGNMLDKDGYISFDKGYQFLVPFIFAPACGFLFTYLLEKIEKNQTAKIENKINPMDKKEIIITFAVLFVCWLIVLVGVFPGFFNYDATDEIIQVITRNFSTHHPLLHVLMLGGIVQAGYKVFGNYNAGIFCYMLFQMILFDMGITYTLYKLRSFGIGKIFSRIVVVVYAAFPVFPMFILCSAKDSLFSLILLLWIINIWDWKRKAKEGEEFPKFNLLLGILWTMLMCMLRNNAMYALLATVILVLLCSRKYWKQIAIVTIISILLTFALNKTMSVVFNADSSEHQEILTVPIQQLTRTYVLEPELFTNEQVDILHKYLPEENLQKYRPKVSDGVKIGFTNENFEKDSKPFFELWVNIGKKAPMSYINAWLMTNYGYWYPDATIDIYRGNEVYTFTYGDSSYFAYETEYPGTRDSKLPFIDEFYRKLSIERWKENVPVVAQLFSPGFLLWVWILLLVYMFIYKGLKSTLPYFMVLMIIATLLLGPTFLPRYVFFLWLCLPVVIADARLQKGEC